MGPKLCEDVQDDMWRPLDPQQQQIINGKEKKNTFFSGYGHFFRTLLSLKRLFATRGQNSRALGNVRVRVDGVCVRVPAGKRGFPVKWANSRQAQQPGKRVINCPLDKQQLPVAAAVSRLLCAAP